MKPEVADYLESLKEIEVDGIFITESVKELAEEHKQNSWYVSMTSHVASLVSPQTLLAFLNRVLANRKEQLLRSSLNVDLQFYLWFDEQACQLRFNLINSMHGSLPFRTRYTLVDKPDDIVESFLHSIHHDGISVSALNEISDQASESSASETSEQNDILKVYAAIIKYK